MTGSDERIELNGVTARADDLRTIVQTNYGHFTALRVEEGGVRGLDLHLARLDAATRALFGAPLEAERVRVYLRHIVDGASALSVRINVFARSLDRDNLNRVVEPDILMTSSPARAPTRTRVRVKSFVFARDAAQIKHVGTFPLFHHRRRAQIDGFDDALFTDAAGRISEGSIWNIGFVAADGGIVWPHAPKLDGVGMQLLKIGLARNSIPSATRSVRLADLANYRAAFLTNASIPARPISAIDAHNFASDEGFLTTLQRCYESNSPQPL